MVCVACNLILVYNIIITFKSRIDYNQLNNKLLKVNFMILSLLSLTFQSYSIISYSSSDDNIIQTLFYKFSAINVMVYVVFL